MSAPSLTRVERLLGAIGIKIIHVYLRLAGRRVRKSDVPWLVQRDGLTAETNAGDAGLLPDFNTLTGEGFDAARVDPNVRHFYEHTGQYQLDVWSETRFPGRLMLWLLVSTVSRYMNQLNFPIFGLETSRGMTSEVTPHRDATGVVVQTGWQRRLIASGRIIYTGFYTTVQPPDEPSPCVKVVFPVPRGNATVILRPSIDDKGHFRLTSGGKKFGASGFYRILDLDEKRLVVRYLKTLRERFEVFTDDEGVVRCDHEVRFIGLPMVRLHYRMRPARPRAAPFSE